MRNKSQTEPRSCQSSPTSIYERKWNWTGFSSRCIIDIYCYNPSGVHPTVLFHFWHTPAPIITPPNMGSITVSQQTTGAFFFFLTWFQKNTPLGPVSFLVLQNEKGSEGQCFRPPLHLWVEDIKAEPIGFFEGRVKTTLTEGRPGSGRARGQAQWFRQLGSPFVKMPVVQPSAQHRMVLILWDSTSRSKMENHCWFN